MSPAVIGINYVQYVYWQIHPIEPTTTNSAPALQIGRMDVPPEVEDEFNQWYNTIFVPNYEKVPGCIRARRYHTRSTTPKYATVYEFEDEQVSSTERWVAARDAHPQSAQIRPRMTHAEGSPGIYKKIFQYQ